MNNNPTQSTEQNFFYSAAPSSAIGVTGNKMRIAKGETTQKINAVLLDTKKKVKSKNPNKTSPYMHHVRGISPHT